MPTFLNPHYANLWLDSNTLKNPSFDLLEKDRDKSLKTLTWLDEELCQCVGTEKYFRVLYKGVKGLLERNLSSILWEHGGIMEKIVTSGIDLMYLGKSYLYVGSMVDLKIREKWSEVKFYSLILSLLNKIKEKIDPISDGVKQKLEMLYLKKFPNLAYLFK